MTDMTDGQQHIANFTFTFELGMIKVIPHDPSHEEVYIAFIMKT